MQLTFLGAARAVTGSCYLLRVGGRTVLLECGQVQGGAEEERQNWEPLPLSVAEIDAVILSHAHIDHSGRLPLLRKQGYTGPIYTHDATRALCEIMLRDAAYLHEKDAEWENRKRRRRGLPDLPPLYTRADAEAVLGQFRGLRFDQPFEVAPGVTVTLREAGHILGAAIVDLDLRERGRRVRLVFSGDLGFRGAPVMDDPVTVDGADVVLLESTYGDRNHRSFAATLEELEGIFAAAEAERGNILIPAFAVGRTQDLLYLMGEHRERWRLDRWHVYLDSPMAIEATEVYFHYRHLYGAQIFRGRDGRLNLPSFTAAKTSEESARLNDLAAGAVIIAGSGMCTGGRILHHLKHHLWRPECHVIFVGFQAEGTLGRKIVDGAEYVRLWQDEIRVAARIHTVGGLSAHADQQGLLDWYGAIPGRPPVHLVHGEPRAQQALAARLASVHGATVHIPARGETLRL
ncbi:MAG TPA: MBL fold metallo-hydrolase [Gammaproteobacteria bacterium]